MFLLLLQSIISNQMRPRRLRGVSDVNDIDDPCWKKSIIAHAFSKTDGMNRPWVAVTSPDFIALHIPMTTSFILQIAYTVYSHGLVSLRYCSERGVICAESFYHPLRRVWHGQDGAETTVMYGEWTTSHRSEWTFQRRRQLVHVIRLVIDQQRSLANRHDICIVPLTYYRLSVAEIRRDTLALAQTCWY